MSKQEMENRIKELEQMVEDRDRALDYADESYADLEDTCLELNNEIDRLKSISIIDVENFKVRLRLNGVLTDTLEKEINDYIRWFN